MVLTVVSCCVSEPRKDFTSIPNVDCQSWEQSSKFPHQIHTSPLHPLTFSFMVVSPIKVDQASLYSWDGGGEGIPACPFMAQKQGVTTQTKTHSRKDHGNDTAEPPAISYQTLRFSLYISFERETVHMMDCATGDWISYKNMQWDQFQFAQENYLNVQRSIMTPTAAIVRFSRADSEVHRLLNLFMQIIFLNSTYTLNPQECFLSDYWYVK